MSCSCQQSDIYKAERDNVSPGRTFKTQDEMQNYVDGLIEKYPKWSVDFPQVRRVEVYWRRKGSSVGWFEKAKEAGIIDMGHREELVVLHEVAHVLCDARYGSKSHDPWFARTYLELVYCAMGSEAYTDLASAFAEHGIDSETDDAGMPGVVCV